MVVTTTQINLLRGGLIQILAAILRLNKLETTRINSMVLKMTLIDPIDLRFMMPDQHFQALKVHNITAIITQTM